jgi:hydrogenase maturation protein HypF
MSQRREKIHVSGVVQGVGFRPFVYRLARDCQLGGFVRNGSEGVLIEVEGASEAIEQFHVRLRREAPRLSQVVELTAEEVALQGEKIFAIAASHHDSPSDTFISADVSICQDCLNELFDPANRRYRFPFINCTNCGPRYTIVYGIPYDRRRTSMQVFPMCAACEREYLDPSNRRFHAQPNACPLCGPRVRLIDRKGQWIETGDPIRAAASLLLDGKILAIRGLGGFHLAVDAHNATSVQELRRRKGRAEKPFALMAPDVVTIEKYVFVDEQERGLLERPARPIVLLRSRSTRGLASGIAPQNKRLGFMLPYTPLHYLLLHDHRDALVMTSGNLSEEPIAISNEEALERLTSLADYFLLHDREILQRCDDSIVHYAAGAPRLIRRSRGYVPAPVFLAHPTRKRVLGCGGELKNAIALSRGKSVFLSQHIGDLDNPAALTFFDDSVRHLQRILEITPELVAHDLHPEYLSTKWALQQNAAPRLGVQHHHAHLVSVMAENGVTEKTIGLILDGTGLGTDGTIWGGEALVGDAHDFQRFAWLQPVALAGGAAAIRQPWRMALSYLFATYGPKFIELDLPFMRRLRRDQIAMTAQMITKNINSPMTSSCGRLFDAVSALLNIRHEVSYEAQAAIELEMIADESCQNTYLDTLADGHDGGPISALPLIEKIVADIRADIPKATIAARFQQTLSELFVRAACRARRATAIRRAGLSGGVFQNVFFFTHTVRRLQEEGFAVLTHQQVPTNDGGLALGQVVIADAAERNGVGVMD